MIQPTRFTHLLLTPFNMRVAESPGLERGWLSHRFELFERFCYPSVRAQSNLRFKWLLFFDADTPDEFKRRVDTYAAWDGFRPYYSTEFNDYQGPVRENIEAGSTHLITTTLDNDDALARTFVDEVQRQFREQAFELINFPTGLRLDLGTGKLYTHRVSANPFISLIERNVDAVTIRGCGPHNLMESRYEGIRDVESEPQWLQVVHGRNIAATGIWGCRRVPLETLGDRFALGWSSPGRSEPRLAIGMENVWRRIERCLIQSLSPATIRTIRRGLKRARRV